MEDASVSSREAPLALSGPHGGFRRVPRHAYVCVYPSARARARTRLSLARTFVRSFVRSYVRTFGPGEPRKANGGKPKKTGRGRDPPRSFRREISPAFPPVSPSFSHGGGLKRSRSDRRVDLSELSRARDTSAHSHVSPVTDLRMSLSRRDYRSLSSPLIKQFFTKLLLPLSIDEDARVARLARLLAMSSNPPLPYHIPFLRPASDGPRTPFPPRSLSPLSNRRLERTRAHAHASCRIASEGASRVSIALPFFMARARAREGEREREERRTAQ